MTRDYDIQTKKVEQFKKEIINICKKYELSISHEDCHGGFVIEDYDDINSNWFLSATDETLDKHNDINLSDERIG